MIRQIVHVDMDAFYASIEQLDNPEYRDKPLVVGALPDEGKGRGVVSAASYEARKYGIHSAMPISRAYRACPQAIFVVPRMKRYLEVSNTVMDILQSFSPTVEQISVDEAFLDCTGTEHLFGKSEDLGKLIKEKIFEVTGLRASIGIASNKSVAKIASDLEKPDGLTICPDGSEVSFLANLDIKRLWGAGKKTIETLHSRGFFKISDIQRSSATVMKNLLGKTGLKLYDLAHGIDSRSVEPGHIRKSISEERTFGEDISDVNKLEETMCQISERLSRAMRKENIRGRALTLKIRLEGFSTFSRSTSDRSYFNDSHSVREKSISFFRKFYQGQKVRLLGISMSNLDIQSQAPEQLGLFEKEPSPTDQVLDNLKERSGKKVTRAIFLGKNNEFDRFD